MGVEAHHHALHCDHLALLVVLSYVISVLGAYSALECALKIPHGRRFGVWLWSAAVAMGGGAIWSMHFIAMLSCQMPIPVSYDPLLTATSLGIAIAVTAAGLSITGTGALTAPRILSGGSISGLGVSAMHYTGMAAMRFPAVTRYDPVLVAASMAIAVAAASVAFWIAFTPRGRWHRFLSALVMGAAVFGMHYTAMAAATFVPVGAISPSPALHHETLAFAVFGMTFVVLGLLFLANHRHDKAALRRSEQAGADALRTSEQRFRGLVEHSSELIVLVDREGTILYESPSGRRVTGYAPEERVGRSIGENLEPEGRDVALRMLTRCLAEPGVPFEAGLRFQRKDRTYADVEAVVVNHLSEPAIRAIVINCRDVSGRKQLEDELRQAHKMEAVGRLAGGIAHDFNNLLAAILGYSELLLKSVHEPEPRRKLSEIRRAAERAAALTHQLLAFSRKQVLAPEVLDLCTVVREIARMLQRLIGEDVELETVFHAAAGLVRVDRGQMEQVIVNLVVNARDAMPHGGKVVVSVSPATSPGGDGASYTTVEVRDTGAGMDAHTRAHIFEPFFTTKGMGKGTGLGLATVHGIVEQSGGFITVESEPGRGSAFRVHLPKVSESATDRPPAEAQDAPGGTETVLLVEDEPALRSVATEILDSLGYRVLPAVDGAEALDVARRHAGEIDLVLTDVVMPGLSGREVTEALRASRPGIRIVYMSGYTDDDVIRRGVLGEHVTFLQKPFTVAALGKALREALDGR